MGAFDSFSINSSGLTAERYRMDTIAENIANANTTRTDDGDPYRRKVVTFQEKNLPEPSFQSMLASNQSKYARTNVAGVKVGGVYEDNVTEMNMVYDPSHPDADENGYVTYPNVNIITEMTNLIDASRAYEANATAFSVSKDIANTGLNVGKG
ncbi:MAG: flagellar basal body rod protein FlgC [Lachnospiraceae bacterium]|nr:flagellar basal body rod protein FlgC [Lachnospiraceae bacterium]